MPFPISILVCLFLSSAPYCFSCSPHLAQPLFLCPLLHRDNGLLTAFQLPQGLRGLDGCRMLMSEPQHWTSAAHTAEGGGGEQGYEAMSKWQRQTKWDPLKDTYFSDSNPLPPLTHLSNAIHLLWSYEHSLTQDAPCSWADDAQGDICSRCVRQKVRVELVSVHFLPCLL